VLSVTVAQLVRLAEAYWAPVATLVIAHIRITILGYTLGQNNSAFHFDGSPLSTSLNQTSTTSCEIQLGLKLV
jgi:hypothetical protein